VRFSSAPRSWVGERGEARVRERAAGAAECGRVVLEH
jgi:hypothetical protein